MMIVDKILDWARKRGYTALYGSAEQVNEMLTNVPFSDSKDGTAVIMHLVTDSATVDGHDRAVVAVYFASLCPFDFDGEALLPEQERLKNIGKELLNDIRTGNVLTYDTPRWQYGYDDYAENVAWVCLRVTLTVSAADCVPILPPAPPPEPEYDIFCPQVISTNVFRKGYNNPCYRRSLICYLATVAIEYTPGIYLYIDWIGDKHVPNYSRDPMDYITEENIQAWKTSMSTSQRPMTEETEKWLRDRIGRFLITYDINPQGFGQDIKNYILVSYSATNYESKPVTVYE